MPNDHRRDVVPNACPAGTQVTIVNGPMLYSLIEEFFPDLHDLQVKWHSPQAATVWMLDGEFRYTRWVASLSLDQRWTLSPVD